MSFFSWFRRRIDRARGIDPELAFWRSRAKRFGARSVLNLANADPEEVTRRQREVLLPLLRGRLRGDERVAVDFGCGPGRFTGVLAEAIDGIAIGLDPIVDLMLMAPRHSAVHYVAMHDAAPLADGVADVVWCCIVLGNIVDEKRLRNASREIERLLCPGGLLFLVENTESKRSIRHFRFRAPEFYVRLFREVPVEVIGEYRDHGERITVFAGVRGHEGQPN